MAQYYRPFILDGTDVKVVNPDYSSLTEQACNDSKVAATVCGLLYKHPCRVAWVGDFYEDKRVNNTPFTGNQIWEMDTVNLDAGEILLYKDPSKVLVNHDKRQCVELNPVCFLHPLPILTSCGNGLGKGDYYGSNKALAGSWAGDLVSVEDIGTYEYETESLMFAENNA